MNTNLWQVNGPVGTIVGEFLGSSPRTNTVVTPSLSFSSSNGMAVTGVSSTFEASTIQSVQSFSGPFTAQSIVTSPAAYGNPFLLLVSSSDGATGVGIAGNLNPLNTGFSGIWQEHANGPGNFWTGIGDGTPLVASPSINTVYTLKIAVDSTGLATLTVSSQGNFLGSSTAQVGTGSLYLLLAQYEGSPNPVGPNEADWMSVAVTTSLTGFTGSNGLLGAIQIGGSPIGVSYSPANGEVYVSNQNLNTVSVINGTTHGVTTMFNVGSTPIGLAYNPVNMAMYVTNAGSNSVSVIFSDNTLSPTSISVGSYPEGIAFDPSNGNLYVANRDSNTISVINATDNTIVTTISDSGGLKGVAFDPVNDYMYFVGIGGVVSVVDGTTNTIVQTLNLSGYPFSSPFGIAFDPSNGNIYIVDDLRSMMYIISGQTNQLLSTQSMPAGPLGITYDPTTNDFFITNHNGIVTLLDATTSVARSQITVSNGDGWGVAVDSATGEVYTANTNAGTVSVIKIVQSTTTSTIVGGSASVNQTSTTGIAVSISGSASSDGTPVTVTSVVLGNAQPANTGALTVEALNYYDVQVNGATGGTATLCITNPSVSSPTIIQYWTGSSWANATNVNVAGSTVCGDIPVAALNGTPIAIGDQFHAKLVDETRAQIVYERLATNPTQTLLAGVKNDGIGGKLAVTVTAYVMFTVTGSNGFSAVYYTQVVTLQGGQKIDGKNDPRLTTSFQPSSNPAHYTVIARIFYSAHQSLTIGDPSFTSAIPDNTRTFQFTTH